MSYLRGFAPWIVFSVVSSLGWQWGAAAALLASVFPLVRARRSGAGADAQILDFGTVLYFAGLSLLAFLDPASGIHSYASALSSCWVALIAWTSLAVRRPFTLGIAKQHAEPSLWSTPRFLRVNTVLTTAWATAFTCTAVAAFLCEAAGAGLFVRVCCQVVGFGAPAYFTHWYVGRARSRRDGRTAAPTAETS